MDSRLTFSSSTKHFWSLNPQNSVAAFECMKPKLREDIIYTLDGWSNCAATSNRVCADVFSLAAATVTISTFKSLTFQISLGFPGFLRLELHWTRCKEPFYVFPVFFILQSLSASVVWEKAAMLFCCKAPGMFRGLHDLTRLSTDMWIRSFDKYLHFQFFGELIL